MASPTSGASSGLEEAMRVSRLRRRPTPEELEHAGLPPLAPKVRRRRSKALAGQLELNISRGNGSER